jgi:hypothetical protein
MAKLNINVGQSDNDKTGDTLRSAFTKVNANFTELYTALGTVPNGTKTATATGTAGQITWDANYIYICTATNTWKRAALTGSY